MNKTDKTMIAVTLAAGAAAPVALGPAAGAAISAMAIGTAGMIHAVGSSLAKNDENEEKDNQE